MVLLGWCLAVAQAQSGFSGVGGPDRAPGFDAARSQPVDPEVAAEVMRREQELLRAIEQHDPRLYRRLQRLARTDRGAYVAAMVRVARVVKRARQDPEYRQRMETLRAKTAEFEALARQYASLPSRDQPAALAKMKQLAGEQMDLKQMDRRERVQEMQARLEALQEEIDRREADREQIIDDFVKRRLERPVDL